MRWSVMALLLSFGVGYSESENATDDDGLALLQTKLVKQHADMSRAEAPACTIKDTPEGMRQASTIFNGDSMGFSHGTGRLDSAQGWSSQNNKIGEWYQLDNGVVGTITGVAIKGRHTGQQWVQSFKVQSKGDTGTWTDVDSGKVYTGNTDSDTQVDVIFNTPAVARYIRIYPQTWYAHMSMRVDIVAECSGCGPHDTPENLRQASTIFNGDSMGFSHGTGRLDSAQGWSSQNNKIGEWYQLDNGVVGTITGVSIKGRHTGQQWVQSFKVQSKGDTGTWTDVDSGKVYTGNTDSDTQVDVIFNTPADARYIRIYPQTWYAHMSMRVDIMTKCDSQAGGVGTSAPACTLHDTPENMRQASTIFNGDSMGFSHGTGRLDSAQGWSSQNNKIGEWYQLDNGVVGTITGVAIKGRHTGQQWVQSFKVQSQGDTGTWTDVDSGKVYTGNTDSDTQVDVIFNTPAVARYIRIYPQTWYAHMSMRVDIIGCAATTTEATTTATTPGSPSGVSTETTTTIPGGNTNVGGADCFGAIATFGPDFECNFKVSSFCAHDSADGLDVSACCQDYCNSNREKTTKRKVSEREDKAAEGVRKSDRQESSSKRKDAEALRKKNSKEAEWLEKRGAQETSNKKAEDERKTKNGYSESKRKNERSWKANRQTARKNAQRREAERKSERALKARNNDSAEGNKKKRASKKEGLAKKRQAKKEMRLKKKSNGQ